MSVKTEKSADTRTQSADSRTQEIGQSDTRTVRQNSADSDRREIEVELRAQLAREREFSVILKSQLEDSNRNAAELRAALRKALEITPRQLEAGTPTNANAATKTGQGIAPIATANNVPTNAPDAVKSPQIVTGTAPAKEPRPLWKVILGLR